MKSRSEIHMPRGPSAPTRIICPSCGECMGILPPGTRIAARGTPSTGRLTGACKCGQPYDVPTVEEGP